MQESDKAESFFTRDDDIWVRMRSGREIRLGPAAEVTDSMKDYVAKPRVVGIVPRNQVR